MSSAPDYNSYSDAELIDVFENIDRKNQLERLKTLCAVMEERELLVRSGPSTFSLSEKAIREIAPPEIEKVPAYVDLPPTPKYDDEGNYLPNEIPLKNRIANSIISFAIVGYGGYGLHINELWVPLSRQSSIVLSGLSAVIMFMAIIFACVTMLIEVVDHYDKRDNEHTYYRFAKYFYILANVAFAIAVIVGLAQEAKLQ
ncbi:MAG: hypothetical protein Alis3KO_32420 [Aliiglaciecola sp.]